MVTLEWWYLLIYAVCLIAAVVGTGFIFYDRGLKSWFKVSFGMSMVCDKDDQDMVDIVTFAMTPEGAKMLEDERIKRLESGELE